MHPLPHATTACDFACPRHRRTLLAAQKLHACTFGCAAVEGEEVKPPRHKLHARTCAAVEREAVAAPALKAVVPLRQRLLHDAAATQQLNVHHMLAAQAGAGPARGGKGAAACAWACRARMQGGLAWKRVAHVQVAHVRAWQRVLGLHLVCKA